MLGPTNGSVACADSVVVDMFVVTVVCCTVGEGCMGCCADGNDCTGGGVDVAHRFRIAVVVFFEFGSSSSALFADSALIRL